MMKLKSARGSILIWTLLLGISLATVFFFFSQRLNSNMAAQRETIEYQNERLFFESYIDYIQRLDSSELTALRNIDNGNISYRGITGTLSNETELIRGILDAGEEKEYEVADNPAKVDWDSCSKDEVGVMELTPAPQPVFDNACNNDYDKTTQSNVGTFKIKALGAPLSYQLSPIGNAILYDREWRLSLEYSIGFRRKLVTNIIFTPDS